MSSRASCSVPSSGTEVSFDAPAVALVARRRVTETWREAVRRAASRASRADEALETYEAALARGAGEHEAAFRTLQAMGLLEAVQLPGDPAAPAAASPQSET